ncbi:MAG: hypothetical protein QMD11_03545 [Smithella sp.]|nr:hypothetical protein [Smithella sp.]
MNVKGTFFATTKATVSEAFGEERWNKFMTRLAAKDKYFKDNVIMSITLIPLDKCILLFDELIDECFNGDKRAYVMFGRIGAKNALSPGGPYQSLMLTKDLKQFVESALPKIYSTYFDGGSVTGKLENNVVYIRITGFPIKHEHYEKLLMGYYKQVLKVFGKKSNETMIRSLTAGDDDLYFKYELKDA